MEIEKLFSGLTSVIALALFPIIGGAIWSAKSECD